MSSRMFKTSLRTLLVALAFAARESDAADAVAVIYNENIGRLDAPMVAKIYKGRVIEVDGIAVTAVNAKSGSAIRSHFLQQYLNENDEKYRAFWTVHVFSGLGPPPPELTSNADIISFVKSTPGAIGYIDEADVPPGVKVLK